MLFRSWATLQDRLAAEFQLHGITTLDAASAYLPGFIARHNQRLAIAPAETTSAFRSAPRDLDRILGCVYERVVARDNTVRIPGRWVQVPPGSFRRSWHKARVEVRETLDGRMLVLHPRHGLIAWQAAPDAGFVLESRSAPRATHARRTHPSVVPPEAAAPTPKAPKRPSARGRITNIRKPATDHPWQKRTSPNGATGPKPGRGRSESLTR